MSNRVRLQDVEPHSILKFDGPSPLSFYSDEFQEWIGVNEFYFDEWEGETAICLYGPGLKRMFHLHRSTWVVPIDGAISC